jgi:hypothetical protein
MRQRVREALDRLPLEYVADELVRRFNIRLGYVRLNVRDGHVVGGEYGWRDESIHLDLPEGELRPDGREFDELERRARALEQRMVRRRFSGKLPPHVR